MVSCCKEVNPPKPHRLNKHGLFWKVLLIESQSHSPREGRLTHLLRKFD